jgi:hypothetical protein
MDQQPPYLPHYPGQYEPPTNHNPFLPTSSQPAQSPAPSTNPPPHPSLFQNTLHLQPQQPYQPPLSRDRYTSERKRRLTSAEAVHRRPSGPSFYANPALFARASGPSFSPNTRYVPAPPMQSSAASTPSEPPRGSSRELAIDLTGDDPLAQQSRPTAGPSMQSPNLTPQRPDTLSQDLILPRWQPDSEATSCPVCGLQFTFWFRKHHCRYVHTASYTSIIPAL